MTTVAELVAALQTLPQDGVVEFATINWNDDKKPVGVLKIRSLDGNGILNCCGDEFKGNRLYGKIFIGLTTER